MGLLTIFTDVLLLSCCRGGFLLMSETIIPKRHLMKMRISREPTGHSLLS